MNSPWVRLGSVSHGSHISAHQATKRAAARRADSRRGHASAVLAASLFHFGTFTVPQVKDYLSSRGVPVRRS